MDTLKVIITGATGMVGEGVLHFCLGRNEVEEILVINRKPCGVIHPKLKEIVHEDFYDLSPIESQLKGYNACFFCLGISSVGMKEAEYYKVTYVLTMHVARILSKHNKDMTFCYISGSGTDTTEKGRLMWARVKGKTENDLAKLPFKRTFGVRPGFIKPTPGLRHINKYYKYIGWFFPIGRSLFPGGFCTMEELALAMIRISQTGFDNPVVSGKDIIELAK